VTAAHWKSGELQGVYRVLVFHDGFEHVTSSVVVEWIADPSSEAGARVIHSRSLFDHCLCSINTPRVTASSTGARLTLTGELTAFPGKKLTCKFELDQDGQSTGISKC
jgi:hypothetical protein